MAIKLPNFSMPPWAQHVDVHCERLSADANAEPINLYSTAIYLVAAYLAYQFGKRTDTLNQASKRLIWIMALVALCGFIFHRQATAWSMYLDSVPMYAFQITFVYLYSSFMTRNQNKPDLLATFITVGFVALHVLISMLPSSNLDGTASVVPMLIFLAIFAYFHNHNVRRYSTILWLAVISWGIAIFLKYIDIEACDYQRFGTHSLWHVASAAAMLFAVMGVLATKLDGRYMRSKKARGEHDYKKLKAIESLNPHDVIGFDEPTLSLTKPNAAKTPVSTKPKK